MFVMHLLVSSTHQRTFDALWNWSCCRFVVLPQSSVSTYTVFRQPFFYVRRDSDLLVAPDSALRTVFIAVAGTFIDTDNLGNLAKQLILRQW